MHDSVAESTNDETRNRGDHDPSSTSGFPGCPLLGMSLEVSRSRGLIGAPGDRPRLQGNLKGTAERKLPCSQLRPARAPEPHPDLLAQYLPREFSTAPVARPRASSRASELSADMAIWASANDIELPRMGTS